MNTNMRALRAYDYGEVDQLVVDLVPKPKPKKGEVLVHVYAAGVNSVDWKMFKQPREQWPIVFPFTPGHELAGVVEAVSPEVKRFKKGQAVLGVGQGTHAEYAIASEHGLVLKPEMLTFDQAATIPVSLRTAWLALFVLADLQEGQRLLIQGAAGGVGSYLVQMGHWKNAHVIVILLLQFPLSFVIAIHSRKQLGRIILYRIFIVEASIKTHHDNTTLGRIKAYYQSRRCFC